LIYISIKTNLLAPSSLVSMNRQAHHMNLLVKISVENQVPIVEALQQFPMSQTYHLMFSRVCLMFVIAVLYLTSEIRYRLKTSVLL
jgi:hypothetical protein